MSRPVLVIENDPNLEGTGRLGEALERSGLPWRSTQAWVDDVGTLDPADFGAIVAMGGEMHALDDVRFPYLAREASFLEQAVEQDVPVLGICLGGQLLARSLGATVQPAGALEGGWVPISPAGDLNGDPVLGHLKEPTGVFSWHVDIFDLPEGATQLAHGRGHRTAGVPLRAAPGRSSSTPRSTATSSRSGSLPTPRSRCPTRRGIGCAPRCAPAAMRLREFIAQLFDGFLSQAARD